jgi:hypothetical protein
MLEFQNLLAARLLMALSVFAVAGMLAGCHDVGDVTGSIRASPAMPADESQLRAYADDRRSRYERDPGSKTASIDYARALRALTRYN